MQQQVTTTNNNAAGIYKPAGARTLADLKEGEMQQIRLLLQGYGGTGKTWASTTFPNPIFLNLDRGLGAHSGKEEIQEVELYNTEVMCKFGPFSNNWPNLKEAIYNWLSNEGPKIPKGYTLVIDNNTSLQNAYHIWYPKNKVYTKSGGENEFAEWRLKQEYFTSLVELMKTFKCHIIWICHEVDARVKKGANAGEYSGKLRPLLTGQFGDEIYGHFTDVFRCMAANKPAQVTKEIAAKFGMDETAFRAMLQTYPRDTHYFWQTESDDLFDAKASSLVGFPKFLDANFESFRKYMRKV